VAGWSPRAFIGSKERHFTHLSQALYAPLPFWLGGKKRKNEGFQPEKAGDRDVLKTAFAPPQKKKLLKPKNRRC
jgi:hypothetical protein